MPVSPAVSDRYTGNFRRYSALFFVSGIAALLYQLVWQRALFTLFGVNIESVTIIVAVFIFGLGLGSLFGGHLSARPNLPPLRTFGLIECGIGAFGMISLPLFHTAAQITAGRSAWITGTISFLLLLLPTLLMGATLPFLVAHVVRRTGRVGESVGILYAVNTLGSALACFLAAALLMRTLGESGCVWLAAALNFFAGITALITQYRSPAALDNANAPLHAGPGPNSRTIPFAAGLFLAAASGFVALAYEILWYRYYSVLTGGLAGTLAQLLGAYLAGVGYGALAVRDAFRKDRFPTLPHTMSAAAALLLWASVIAFLCGPAMSRLASVVPAYAVTLTLPIIFAVTSLLGAIFPLLAQATVPSDNHSGRRISYFYLANILGSVAGTLAIGFVLMDHLSTPSVSILLLATGLLLSAVMLVTSPGWRHRKLLFTGALAALALLSVTGSLYQSFYERLILKHLYVPGTKFASVVENRSGVIAVAQDRTVYGGGVYDGRFSTGLVNDINHIYRAYATAGFHQNPREVLMIGLSSGSWAQVIANNPNVEHLTIIEINPGYTELLPKYQAVESLPQNPKIKLVIDDGRRWLIAHPDRRFDLIVMNSSFHWRVHVTNVLSAEFLRLARQHLNPSGILYYNTTGSPEVLKTAATVFPYVLRVGNFAAASNQPIKLDRDRWAAALRTYMIDGKPVFNLQKEEDQQRMAQVLAIADTLHAPRNGDSLLELEDDADIRKRLSGTRVITDDNMGTEWR